MFINKIQLSNFRPGLFFIFLSMLIVSHASLADAQSLPAEGATAVINSELNIVNTNPRDGDPVVTQGGRIVDASGSTAAVAFNVNQSRFHFSSAIAEVSSFTAAKWLESGADGSDVEVRCWQSNNGWTTQNVDATVNLTFLSDGAAIDLDGSANLAGVCAVFVTSS